MNEIELLNEARRVLSDEADAILNVRNKINSGFSEAVNLINNSNKVVISGVGKSGLIAKKIAATFSSVGITGLFLDPVGALHGDLGILSENDVIILISKSGSTEEISRLVPYLKVRKVKIIAIVGNIHSYISRSADVVLDSTITHEACPLNLAPMSSAIVALALGDALAAATMVARGFTVDDFAWLHPMGQLGRNITIQVKDVMHSNSALPLILSGKTFRDAIIEITNKKLGCVCVVDADKILMGIITDGDVRRVLNKYDDIRSLTVDDTMTRNPISIQPQAYLNEALSLMENRESQINVLPVVNNANECIGIIRVHDIIRSEL